MLELSLLGTFAAVCNGVPLGPIGSLRARNLLIYLVLHNDRPHARAALAAFLWPDLPEARGIASVRQALYVLQHWIRSSRAPVDLFITTHLTVAINREQLYCDALELQAAVEQAAQHRHRSIAACASCAARLHEAAARYRGDLVHGIAMGGSNTESYELWLQHQRERLRLLAGSAYEGLVTFQERRQQFAAMVETARNWLALDAWHEPAQRSLMRALAANGQRAAALRQYEALRRMLHNDLALAPDSSTEQLAAAIRAGSGSLVPERFSIQRRPLPLIGRAAELQRLTDLLSDRATRLVTLTGIGGVGKTALATVAAQQLSVAFAAGAAFVDLAGCEEDAAMVAAIGAAVGCRFGLNAAPLEHLVSTLHGREALLVLDNLDLVTQGMTVVALLLDRLPLLTLLATSRRRLRISGETVFEVQGLRLTAADGGQSPAVQLFLQRLDQLRPGHDWTADLDAITTICRLVGGLPLAIDLAAQQVRLQSCSDLARNLEQSLAPLRNTVRDSVPRHRTIERLFRDTWQQLSADGRRLCRAISRFRGSFRLQDAIALLAGHAEPSAVAAQFAALVDQSLISGADPGSFVMHTLLRRFVSRRRDVPEALTTAIDLRYRQLFLTRLNTVPLMTVNEASLAQVRALSGQFDDIQHALQCAASAGADGDVTTAAFNFASFARLTGRTLIAGEALAQLGGNPASPLQPATRRRLLVTAAALMSWCEHIDDAEQLLSHADHLSDAALPHDLQALALITESLILSRRSHHSASLAAAHRVLDLPTAAVMPWIPIEAHLLIGRAAMMARDVTAARCRLERAVELARQSGDLRSLAATLNELAQLCIVIDDLTAATPLLEQALRIARTGADALSISVACSNLGPLLVLGGADVERGLALCHEAIVLALDCGRDVHSCDRYHALAFAQTHLQRHTQAVDTLQRLLPLINRTVPLSLLLQILETCASLLMVSGQAERAITAFTYVAFHPASHPYFRRRAVTALRGLDATALAPVPETPVLHELVRELITQLTSAAPTRTLH